MLQQSTGVLRVVGPEGMAAADRAQAEQLAASDAAASKSADLTGLAGYIRTQFDMMKRHRDTAEGGWSNRLLAALRCFNGVYDADKLSEIKKFGGSEIYARLIAMKCRGATSLLHDVYLGQDRPWGIDAGDDPDVPPGIMAAIEQLVRSELQTLVENGAQPDAMMIRDRMNTLVEAARQAAKKKAANQARIAEDKLDELLKQGGFYKALAEFLVDLPLFPFACIKGPVVKMVPSVVWENGKAISKDAPRLFWYRMSPFDIWWTPGVSDIEVANFVERSRLTRGELNDLLDLPGYDHDAVAAVLDEYGRGGLVEDWDLTDSQRAVQENRENPQMNQSGMITCLEFTGNVQGRMLLDQGMDKTQIPEPLRDYFVQAWLIGRHIIKVQLSPSPRRRHPYYITSFEKVPGTPVGNGLPDILNDIQDVCNATLRALVNNLSISSGPQVVVNKERLAPGEDGDEMFPWKRWQVMNDPMANANAANKAVEFFQPASHAQELLTVYKEFVNIADDLSAIPKYLAGGGASGGAGRTASGLAMLMGNASKILQTVAANVDRDVLDPLLTGLFDMILLTDTSGLLTGQEKVRIMGVTVAVQKETQRARQLEFLAATANPIDIQIMGPAGRAEVLRSVSGTLGMDGAKVVPSADEIEKQQKMAAQMAQQQGIPGHGGVGQAAADAQGGQQGSAVNNDTGPRTNITGGPQ